MNRHEIYNKITQQIKEKLQLGTIPWRKSWKTGLPMNYTSKRPYNGINFLSLSLEDYASPYYMTFLQCKQRNGLVNKGSDGNMIVYWNLKEYMDESISPGKNNSRAIPFIRYSYVFNLSQTNLYMDNQEKPTIFSCEEIISNIMDKPVIKNNIRGCYYKVKEDYISIPVITDFNSAGEYYSSLFHELIHWTGNPSRLNRLTISFEKHEYSSEELVAEIGSAYLCGLCGIDPGILDNQVSYINGWLGQLENDPMLFINATVHAQKAVNFILGLEQVSLNNIGDRIDTQS